MGAILTESGVKVDFFDTAEKMTMKRYQRFNKYLMVDNEVGNDVAALNTRLSKSIQLLKKRMISQTVKELDNFRQMVYNAFMEYSPKNMALALLVDKIDGEKCEDITASGLQKVLDRLEELGVTQELANSTVLEVKKK